jgi:hypothetical protein
VDVNPPQVPQRWAELPYWRLRVGDDMAPETRAWAPAELDVLFIDTSHHYEHTLAELRTYAPRVKPGGVILLHDTEVINAGLDDPYPVTRALNAYCAAAGLTWENRQGCYGLGVLEMPAA